MKLTGQNEIAASPEVVWQALNDPEVLSQAMPGCESMEKISDTAFKATIVTKIGPIKAKFNGEVELQDLDPPNGYKLVGSGSGGSVGNAKGAATVTLTPQPGGGTLLSYDVEAIVTGKLAQLGARLINSTAKILAGKFFNSFEKIVSDRPSPKSTEGGGALRWVLVGGSVLVLIGLITWWALTRAS